MCSETSTVGSQAENMEMEGATFAEEAGLLHGLTPQHLAAQANLVCLTKSKRPSRSKQQAITKRKRSVKLSQLYMALAAVVPGAEKVDETTVLENSIEYLKQLQGKVKSLEAQRLSYSESCTSDQKFSNEPQLLPEVEARVSDRNVLVKIQCELCKGVVVKIIEEIEKLHLSVVSSHVIRFGLSTLDVTIMAQMDDEFIVTVKDLVKSLRSSLNQFTAKNLHEVHEN